MFIIRFILRGRIQHRLLSFRMLQAPLSGAELSAVLARELFIKWHIPPEAIIGATHDRAAINNVAMEEFSGLSMCTNAMYSPCFSHLVDGAGEHLRVPLTMSFMSKWNEFFAHSTKAKSLFFRVVGVRTKSSSATRWWSRFDQIEQIVLYFPLVKAALRYPLFFVYFFFVVDVVPRVLSERFPPSRIPKFLLYCFPSWRARICFWNLPHTWTWQKRSGMLRMRWKAMVPVRWKQVGF